MSGQHVDITPSLRAPVENKLERVLRHSDQIIDIAVVLGVEQPSEKERRHRAEVNRVKGHVFLLDQHAEDLYAAVDLLIDRLDRQVLKYKEKVQGHHIEPVKRLSTEI